MSSGNLPVAKDSGLGLVGAFVVHVHPASTAAVDTLAGRVEHVRSGLAGRFTGVAELLAFMHQTFVEQGVLADDEPASGLPEP